MSEIEVLSEFKTQLILFLDELIDQFPQESDLVVLRIFLKDQIPIKDAVDIFVFHINKNNGELREMIKNRNEAFFLDHNVFQRAVGTDKVNHFKRLWRSGLLDDEDKKIMWQWVDTFVFLADKYSKKQSS